MKQLLTSRLGAAVACALLAALFGGGVAQAINDTMFKYVPAKTGYVTIPPAAFVPRNNNLAYDIVDFIANTTDGVNSCFSAPISLPQGASVSAITVYRRSGANNMTISIDSVEFATGNSGAVLAVQTLPDTSNAWQPKKYVLSTTIDNAHFTYTAYFCTSSINNVFGGLRITFTYNNAGY